MAFNYEVKKRVFGFDKTKTEKYVAQLKTLGMVGFGDLCDEVTKVGMVPRGVVKNGVGRADRYAEYEY